MKKKTKKPVKKAIKKAIKKVAKKAVKKVKAVKVAPKRKPIGEVTHFYDQICVAVVRFNQGVEVGEEICFEGPKDSFSQVLDSMQLEHQPIQKAKKGQEVGVKVKKPVKEGHKVYRA
jgi:putative protease